VELFAYPYGGHNFRIRRLVAKAGFRMAFTTEPKPLKRLPLRHALRVPRLDLRAAVGREPL
jgi:peptidoglycan/xylan/chitin deacetylase (PgdA/CDA1 family)